MGKTCEEREREYKREWERLGGVEEDGGTSGERDEVRREREVEQRS